MNGLVVVWTNLKPKKLLNSLSEGMVMCAQDEDKKVISMIRPIINSIPGETVKLLNNEMEHLIKKDKQSKTLNNSNKIKKILKLLYTDNDGFCCYGNFKLSTNNGLLEKSEIKNGIIS